MRFLRHIYIALLFAFPPTDCAFAQRSPSASYIGIAREGYRLGKPQAEALEALLTTNPDDLAARARLLGFYFRGLARSIYGPGATIAARRAHILWLVGHHPESEIVGLSEATIDAAGHSLADKDGYDQVSALWQEQVARHPGDVAVLGHAAKFFQLSNKEYTTSLLKRAQQIEPNNREWPGKVGYVYALAILGVDMMNQNGLPTSHNPDEAKSRFAVDARDQLNASADPVVVGGAGRILGLYGLMLTGRFRGSGQFTVEYASLAEALLIKAQGLEPGNRQWPADLEQFRKLRSEAGLAK